nr:CorA family divalent cation transporter [Solirubrobacter ginsenosidimutans]
MSLADTSSDDVIELVEPARHALSSLSQGGATRTSRAFIADDVSIAFALQCYVELNAQTDQTSFRLRPLKVHVVVTADYLVTLHEERVSLPAALLDRTPGGSGPHIVHAVLDAMLASSFDALDEVELTLDALAAMWTDGDETLVPRATLREAAARLATMRRSLTAEETVLARVTVEIGALRGFDGSDGPSFEQLREHVNRLLASIDAAANAMGMLLDLQLNQRAYLVSVVATIFVPLTFLTGFFGMNFGWMVDHTRSPSAFWLLGVAVPVVSGALLWRLLMRRMVTGGAPRGR